PSGALGWCLRLQDQRSTRQRGTPYTWAKKKTRAWEDGMPAAGGTIEQVAGVDNRWPEQAPWVHSAPDVGDVRRRVGTAFRELVRFTGTHSGAGGYEAFERELIGRVFGLSRLLIVLFFALSEGRTEVPASFRRGRCEYRRQP